MAAVETSDPAVTPAPGLDGAFNPDVLVHEVAKMRGHLHDLPARAFVRFCCEVGRLIKVLGTVFKMASEDVEEKTAILTVRLNELDKRAKEVGLEAPRLDAPPPAPAPAPDAPAPAPDAATATAPAAAPAADERRVRLTLQFLIADELARGVAAVNDAKTFVSGSRTLLRLMWFLDFVVVLVGHLHNTPAQSLKETVQRTYEVALAPHHPWLLRKTIGAATLLLPHRDTFVAHIGGPAVLDQLWSVVPDMNAMRETLWALYKAHKIEHLP
jgi:hypothetical protein